MKKNEVQRRTVNFLQEYQIQIVERKEVLSILPYLGMLLEVLKSMVSSAYQQINLSSFLHYQMVGSNKIFLIMHFRESSKQFQHGEVSTRILNQLFSEEAQYFKHRSQQHCLVHLFYHFV